MVRGRDVSASPPSFSCLFLSIDYRNPTITCQTIYVFAIALPHLFPLRDSFHVRVRLVACSSRIAGYLFALCE